MIYLLPPTVITTALAAPGFVGPTWYMEPGKARSLALQAVLAYGSGGTQIDAYVQTSLDGGLTWADIRNFEWLTVGSLLVANHSSLTPILNAFTPDDGALAANSGIDGLMGDLYRVKVVSSGTYAGNTALSVFASGSRLRPA